MINKIAISAGHNVYINNNFDCGATGNDKRESDLTKSTVSELNKILSSSGVNIKDVTPYDQRFTSSKAAHIYRCTLVDKFGAELFLDIHLNSGGGTGVECWVYSANGVSANVARRICTSISQALDIPNRGLKVNPNYWSLSLTSKPAIIVECAFVDSANDVSKFNPQKCAAAIAEAITEKTIENTPVKKVDTTPARTWYEKGDKGSGVRQIQLDLIALGYSLPRYGADSWYGNETIEAVKKFQVDNGLKVDGYAGVNTLNKMKERINTKQAAPEKPQVQQKKTWEINISGEIVRRLQTELNNQFGAGLKVDAYCGDNTMAKLVTIRKGARGNITKIIQELLIRKGYSVGKYGADSVFGNGTYNAVCAMQRDNGLVVDGVVGQNTWKALLRK